MARDGKRGRERKKEREGETDVYADLRHVENCFKIY
jgi:hypothetical protein